MLVADDALAFWMLEPTAYVVPATAVVIVTDDVSAVSLPSLRHTVTHGER